MARWLWAAVLLAATVHSWKRSRPFLHENHHHPRIRRQMSNSTIHLHLFGWNLELHENRAIRSPYYDECKFYKGRVLYEEGSMVTVTECGNQLYGLVQVGGEEFVVQPTWRKNGRGHVVRRRDVIVSEPPTAYNLTGDTVADLDFDLEDEEPVHTMHVRPRHSNSDIEYYRDVMPVSRPISGVKGLWLEVAVVADHTMLKFHGRERVNHYILALMNIVSAIFNDPSLESNMTLVINKLFMYEEKDPVIKYGNVKKSLEAVNKWNYRHLQKLPPESTGWDATVWLTRALLGGPSGFAPVGGVCSHTRSAAINRDEGLTSAFVIAHELGHLLGLTHDGDEQCAVEARHGSVMAPTVLATLHNYAWSSCSKRLFHEKAPSWWCLHERSSDEGLELGGAKELSNYVFTMDEQCRTEFGDGFSVCKSVKVRAACSRLWCADRDAPHVCHSKRAPPLEGTPCGHERWCVDRVCEPMPGRGIGGKVERKEHESGSASAQWDEWNAWSECSADCGYGLRTRTRRCLYKGSLMEGACEGAGSQVSTCWAGQACAGTRDHRSDMCARQGSGLIPHVHSDESKQCEAWCVNYNGGEPTSFGALPDGAPCTYGNSYDICFQGTCVKGQCNSSDATCNWCPDGYCNNYTHVYSKQLGQGWTKMAVVPHNAHLFSLHISTPIPIHIAVRERRRDRHILELSKLHTQRFQVHQQEDNYLKYDSSAPQNLQIVEVDSNVIDIEEDHFGWRGEVVAAGTLITWNQTETDVYISSLSQLQSDMMIMGLPEHTVPSEEQVSVQVSVNYSVPATRTSPLEYRWSTERGPCSVSCGGGIRMVRTRCSARDQSCASKPPRYEVCNSHRCEFKWASGEWEECSATCGDHGLQERQLFCVSANASTSSRRHLIENSVSPALCSSNAPEKQQPCNRVHCPVYWQELPWTPCSTTCGRGISRRPLTCPARSDTYCGPKPRERRRRCRLRRCPGPRRRPPHTCKGTDTTHYCELFNVDELTRNCALPPFKKYCCNACKSVNPDLLGIRGAG